MDHMMRGMGVPGLIEVQPAAAAQSQQTGGGRVGVIPFELMDDFHRELQQFSSTLSGSNAEPQMYVHSNAPKYAAAFTMPQHQQPQMVPMEDHQPLWTSHQQQQQQPQAVSMDHQPYWTSYQQQQQRQPHMISIDHQPLWASQQQQQQQQQPFQRFQPVSQTQMQSAPGGSNVLQPLPVGPAEMISYDASPFLSMTTNNTQQPQTATAQATVMGAHPAEAVPGLAPLPNASCNFDTFLSLFETDVDMVGGVVAPEEWQAAEAKPDLQRLDSVLQMLQSVASTLPEDSTEGLSVSREASSTELDRSRTSSEAYPAGPIDTDSNVGDPEQSSTEGSEPSTTSASAPPPPVPQLPPVISALPKPATDLQQTFKAEPPGDTVLSGAVETGTTTAPQLLVESHMKDMAAMLSGTRNQAGVDDFEKKLGRSISQTNEVSEFCDLLSKTCIEAAESSSGSGKSGSVCDLLSLKSGPDAKSRDGLGIRASMAGQKGKGRVRPKDHMVVMERYLGNLKTQQASLSEEVQHLTTLNTKMDLMLNMKIGVMDEIKVHNVALDSYLQELVISRVSGSLQGMKIEERGKMTSMQSIFLRDKPELVNQTIADTMNAYRTMAHNITKVVGEMTASKEAQTEANMNQLDMYCDSFCTIIENLLAASGSNMFFYFIKELDDQNRDLGMDFIKQKYAAVNQLLKPEKAQLRKVFALNAIFTSRVKALVEEKKKLMEQLSNAQMASASVSMYDQCSNMRRVETLICKLRLNNISMLEARMLFNTSFVRKVLTPWQASILVVHTYPIMPDGQAVVCELLGVENMLDVPLERYKDFLEAAEGVL